MSAQAGVKARLRPYASLFRIRLIASMQYRAAAWAGVATQFCFGFLFLMIFAAFYDGAATPPPMPYERLVSYLWLQQAFLALIVTWYQDQDLLQTICSGNVAYELARPYNLYALWFVRIGAQRVASASMRCLPILLLAGFLPKPYNLLPPVSWGAFAAFALSLSLALLVTLAVSMFVYVLTFVTLTPLGARLLICSASDFLAGLLVPLPLMPDAMRGVLNWLPFRYMADFPFQIYAGQIPLRDALVGIGAQLFWLVALVALGELALRRCLSRAVIQGG